MNDSQSLPEVKGQSTYVKIEEVDGESFLNMQESLTKRPKEAFMKEQSRTDSYSAPLYISSTTKPSKVVVKIDTLEQHHVYVHINKGENPFNQRMPIWLWKPCVKISKPLLPGSVQTVSL